MLFRLYFTPLFPLNWSQKAGVLANSCRTVRAESSQHWLGYKSKLGCKQQGLPQWQQTVQLPVLFRHFHAEPWRMHPIVLQCKERAFSIFWKNRLLVQYQDSYLGVPVILCKFHKSSYAFWQLSAASNAKLFNLPHDLRIDSHLARQNGMGYQQTRRRKFFLNPTSTCYLGSIRSYFIAIYVL